MARSILRRLVPVCAVACVVVILAATAGCQGRPTGPTRPATSASPAPSATFGATVSPVTAADLPFTWRPGCPVGPADLRLMHLGYWGFDGLPHVGTMVVNAAVTADVSAIFATLYRARFPIRRMQPVDAYRGSDPDSMAADNTSGFNCREAVASGAPHWSVHAYGEAIDVDTVENPYVQGGTVTPEAGRAFLDRSRSRAGMAVPDGVLVRAFTDVGWFWGGRWAATPDYQHFSRTGG